MTDQSTTLLHTASTAVRWDWWCESPKRRRTDLITVFGVSPPVLPGWHLKRNLSLLTNSVLFFFSIQIHKLKKRSKSMKVLVWFENRCVFLLEHRRSSPLLWEWAEGRTDNTDTGFNKPTDKAAVPRPSLFLTLVATFHNSKTPCGLHTGGCPFMFCGT